MVRVKGHTHVCSYAMLTNIRGIREQYVNIKQHIYNCLIKECAGVHNRFCVLHVPQDRNAR